MTSDTKSTAVMCEELRRNLLAAGCSKRFITEFEACLGDSRRCAQMLAEHRQALLDRIHREEQQISCLDYLVKNGVPRAYLNNYYIRLSAEKK